MEMVELQSVCSACPMPPPPSSTGVGLWALDDSAASVAQGQNLTIWLHTQANFSGDGAKVACRTGVKTITRIEAYTQCVLTPSVRYVTIQRFAATATSLGLMEIRIYRKSKPIAGSGMHSCCAP